MTKFSFHELRSYLFIYKKCSLSIYPIIQFYLSIELYSLTPNEILRKVTDKINVDNSIVTSIRAREVVEEKIKFNARKF